MLETIISAIVETLAGAASEAAMSKATAKMGRKAGWISLTILVLLAALCIWLGIYILSTESVAIGILMLLIGAVFVAFILWAIVKSLRMRRERR